MSTVLQTVNTCLQDSDWICTRSISIRNGPSLKQSARVFGSKGRNSDARYRCVVAASVLHVGSRFSGWTVRVRRPPTQYSASTPPDWRVVAAVVCRGTRRRRPPCLLPFSTRRNSSCADTDIADSNLRAVSTVVGRFAQCLWCL